MIIVITGGTSGIGLQTAKLLASKGHVVYSLARRTLEDSAIHYLSCDVTYLENIQNAVNLIIKQHQKIDVLINNAGMGVSGAFEYQTTDEIDKIMDVNIKGVLNTTQVCLPYIRQTKGKIINIGSIASEIPIPFQTMYSLTKASVLNFSMALQNELRPFKVKVSCVLPGDIKTNFTSNRIKNQTNSDYDNRIERSVSKMEKDEKNGMAPIKIANKINKIIKKKNPPLICTVGFSYKFILFLKRILPAKLVNYIVYKMYAK